MVPSLGSPPKVRKRTLPSGLTILQQDNPHSQAFCMGVCLNVGSREERQGEEGLCHFLEHMLFKGTTRRSSFQISQEVEKIGGSIDAFTTKEQLCVYVQVLNGHRNLAIEILSDMFMNSTFPSDQIRLEKEVVLDEIRDVLDSPDDMIHEIFTSTIFPRHPLGKPILGQRSSVAKFSRKKLLSFLNRNFKAGNVIVSVYGNIDIRVLSAACERLFAFPNGSAARKDCKPSRSAPRRKFLKRNLHQQHICLGTQGFSYGELKRFPLMILTTLVGGGMSSRLFQRVREELGLAYDIYTYAEHGRDAGLVGTYLSVKPANTGVAVRAVLNEYRKILKGEFKPDELRDTKEHIKGSILLGLETSAAKMMRMARNQTYFGRQVSERELIRSIDGVTPDQIVEVAEQILDPRRLTMVSMGPSSAGLRINSV
jgi:predicted Zn-dependent peptidase